MPMTFLTRGAPTRPDTQAGNSAAVSLMGSLLCGKAIIIYTFIPPLGIMLQYFVFSNPTVTGTKLKPSYYDINKNQFFCMAHLSTDLLCYQSPIVLENVSPLCKTPYWLIIAERSNGVHIKKNQQDVVNNDQPGGFNNSPFLSIIYFQILFTLNLKL